MKHDKVLITGGMGFIGRCIAGILVEHGWDVLLFDNLNPQVHGAVPRHNGDKLFQHPCVQVFRGDVRHAADWAKVLPEVRYVVHLASETGTAQSMYEISRYTETNVGGISELLNYLANQPHDIRKIILASSRAVYGEGAYRCVQCGLVYPGARSGEMLSAGQWEPQCPTCAGEVAAVATPESAVLAPASIYAATKLAQEDLLHIASKALGIPAVIFRMQNVYGEGQSLRNPYTGLLTILAGQLRVGRMLNLFEDGQASRDFVHVDDAARSVTMALHSDAADGCTLNVGSGRATSVEKIAALLCDCFGLKRHYRITGQYRLGDVRHGLADLERIQAKLGFEPQVSLEAGLERLVDWVKAQPIEPDQWETATRELVERGLMPCSEVQVG